jgi:hypothetical protein
MANFIPRDLDALAQEVAHSLLAKHQRPDLLRAFLQHAQLRLGDVPGTVSWDTRPEENPPGERDAEG